MVLTVVWLLNTASIHFWNNLILSLPLFAPSHYSLFFFAPACQLESLGRVLSISPTSPSCMSSHRWGKLSINQAGPPKFYLQERPAGDDYNPSDITARSALTSLFFALRWIFSVHLCLYKILNCLFLISNGNVVKKYWVSYSMDIFTWSRLLAVQSHCYVSVGLLNHC